MGAYLYILVEILKQSYQTPLPTNTMSWISDKLIEITGASDDMLVDFCQAQAKEAASAKDLLTQLTDMGLEGNGIKSFASELWGKYHVSKPKPNVPVASASTKYDLLLDPVEKKPSRPPKRVSEESKSTKRRRRYSYSDSESEDDRREPRGERRDDSDKPEVKQQAYTVDDIHSDYDSEKDARERDEFAQRLAERDSKKGGKKDDDRAARNKERERMADDLEKHREELDQMRSIARKEYLSKREQQQLYLLEREVEDFEDDVRKYGWENLTKEEQREIEYKRQVLKIAQERKEIDRGVDGYSIPDAYITEGKRSSDKDKDSLMKRYERKPEREMEDGELWEQSKRGDAGIREKTHEKDKEEDKYEFVFDPRQAIKFTADTDEDKGSKSKSEAEKAMLKQIEDAKSMPSRLTRFESRYLCTSTETRFWELSRITRFLLLLEKQVPVRPPSFLSTCMRQGIRSGVWLVALSLDELLPWPLLHELLRRWDVESASKLGTTFDSRTRHLRRP